MNGTDMYNAMSKIDENLIDGSFPDESDRKTVRKQRLVKLIPVLAALVVVFTAGTAAVVAITAEAKEYREAVRFFDENGLPMEGLTRSDVKAVYKDITTQKFTYGKTAEVLKATYEGWEIIQNEPTPDELSVAWNSNMWSFKPVKKGFSYEKTITSAKNESGTFDLEATVVTCYRDGGKVWQQAFPGAYISDCVKTGTGTVVWGTDESLSLSNPERTVMYAFIAHVDDGGNVTFSRTFVHGFIREDILNAFDNGDGSLTVISRGGTNTNTLCIADLDAGGRETRCIKKVIESSGAITHATRYNDGYMLLMKAYQETGSLLYVDREGNVTGAFSYEEDGFRYEIRDMAEFGGRIYISTYAYPAAETSFGRDEIGGVLQHIYNDPDNVKWNIQSGELTPLVRDVYTAVLLVVKPGSGEVDKFFSVKGSLGASLNAGASGTLDWDVESITTTFFSPATNSFTIGGRADVFRYSFDESGNLLGHAQTGETAPYRR